MWFGLYFFICQPEVRVCMSAFISLKVFKRHIGTGDSISSRQTSLLIFRMLFGIQLCFGFYGMKSPTGEKTIRALGSHSGDILAAKK